MTWVLTLVWCATAAQYQVPPVNPPKCVAGCDEGDPSSSSSSSSQRAPEETAAQQAAREAAAEEARRRAEAADQAARQAADESRNDLDRLETRGARLRDEAQRFDAFERNATGRERVRPEVRDAMAPVRPPAQPTPAFSLEAYIRRLNEEDRARQRGLHSTPPPPLGTVAPAPTRPAPATIPADQVGVLTVLARQRAEARAIADELAWEELWRRPERHVPGVKTLRSLIEDGTKLFEGLNAWNLATLKGGFSQADQVLTLGRSSTSRPSLTSEDNTALLEQRERDLTRTTSEFFSDKVRSSFLGGVVGHSGDWGPKP